MPRIYKDLDGPAVIIEGYGTWPLNNLVETADGADSALVTLNGEEIDTFEFGDVLTEAGAPAATDQASLLAYLNQEFNHPIAATEDAVNALIAAAGAGASADAVTALRTTAFADVPTTWTNITFDTTTTETDPAVIGHNDTNRDQFNVGVTGTYLLSYTAAAMEDLDFRITRNGTAVPASQIGMGEDVDASVQFTGVVSKTIFLNLTAGDVIRVQMISTAGAAEDLDVNATFSMMLITGIPGIQGPAGNDGADGVVQTIVAGSGIAVDSTTPSAPIVSATSTPVIKQVRRKNMTNKINTSVTIDSNSPVTSTSGTAFNSHTITMQGPTNTVRVQATIPVDVDGDGRCAVALIHRGVSVLAVQSTVLGKKEFGDFITFDFYDTPGAGTHTYSIRVGEFGGTTVHVNELSNNEDWVGQLAKNCNITLTEIG